MEACGGHTLVIEQDCSSDTVSFIVDGETVFITDDGTYCAIIDAIRSLERPMGFEPTPTS